MQNILSDRKTLKNHKFKTWDWEASIRHNKKPTEGKNVRLEERNGTIEKKDKRSGKKQEICCQNIRKFSNQSEEVIFFEERISLKCCEEPNPSKMWLERINKRVIQLDTELNNSFDRHMKLVKKREAMPKHFLKAFFPHVLCKIIYNLVLERQF